jgi:hypothetical protein
MALLTRSLMASSRRSATSLSNGRLLMSRCNDSVLMAKARWSTAARQPLLIVSFGHCVAIVGHGSTRLTFYPADLIELRTEPGSWSGANRATLMA